MRLGSRNRRQGNWRNRQMFFEAPEVEPVFFDESGLLKLIFRQDDCSASMSVANRRPNLFISV